jgi:SAM-dependent methyltransferase
VAEGVNDGHRPSTAWYRATADRPPTPLVVRAAKLAGGGARALDLGAGGGADTRHLLERAFHVTAVDADPEAEPLLRRLPHQERLRVVICRFEDLAARFDDLAAPPYKLVYSSMSLFFLSRPAFGQVWQTLEGALAPGGVLAVATLGAGDSWQRTRPSFTEEWELAEGGTFLTRDEVDRLLQRFEVLEHTHGENEIRMGPEGHVERHEVVRILARRPSGSTTQPVQRPRH